MFVIVVPVQSHMNYCSGLLWKDFAARELYRVSFPFLYNAFLSFQCKGRGTEGPSITSVSATVDKGSSTFSDKKLLKKNSLRKFAAFRLYYVFSTLNLLQREFRTTSLK